MGIGAVLYKGSEGIKCLSTINARAETITKAPTSREPFKKRCCLIPASFIEWPKEVKPPKQPYAIELGNGSLFAFAGLWGRLERQGRSLAPVLCHRDHGSERTDGSDPSSADAVILHARDYDRWLDREETERLPFDLLWPFEPKRWRCTKPLPVNNVRNNGPEMLRVVEQAALNGDLPL